MSAAVRADYGDSGLISQVDARRYGLERAWFTQVSLDSARGRMTDLTYFVSATQSHTVYEVRYQDRKQTFSERDTDRFGDLLGKEAAEKEAKAFVEELKLREIEGKLQTIQVPEITLYVVTDRAVLHAIDAETGRTRWTTVVGNRNYPTERPGISENYVAVLNGSTLHLLKRDTGEMAWIRKIQGVASAGPALTEEYVIVPTFTGGVEWYDIEETRTLPEISRSNGRVLIQPTVTPLSVLWPTDRGLLYVARTTQKTAVSHGSQESDRFASDVRQPRQSAGGLDRWLRVLPARDQRRRVLAVFRRRADQQQPGSHWRLGVRRDRQRQPVLPESGDGRRKNGRCPRSSAWWRPARTACTA